MIFRVAFFDPFKPDVIEVGDFEKDKVMELFENVPWSEYLNKMETAKEGKIYHAPGLEVDNKENQNGLYFSPVQGGEWGIFYIRPKLVKRFFGLSEKMNNSYMTELWKQTEADVMDCLQALLENDLQFLEDKFK